VTAQLPEFIEKLVLDGSKIGWWPDRIAAWERGERIAPITMDVAWTRACQAGCHFCYAQLQASKGAKIKKQHAWEFLEDAAEIGVKGVSLISDGESSVVPYYADSIVYGASLGIQMGIGTNGITLTKPVLEKVLPHLTYGRFNFSAGTMQRYKEIMGLHERDYWQVLQNIKDAVAIKQRDKLPVSLNMNMVVMPEDADQIIPLAKLAATELRPDYLIFKHTADDVDGHLGVDYSKYDSMKDLFLEAQSYSDDKFQVVVKWSRIKDEGKREYSRCFGPPFILQMSGNGLIAPCGFLFNEEYKAFHIGNITRKRFKDIWASDRYKEVIDYLASDYFNPQKRCGPNCLQHNTNDWLFKYKQGQVTVPTGASPDHLGFL
jgi:MoaA/NifB/PqqE/SkfB family radical SAM enzyme